PPRGTTGRGLGTTRDLREARHARENYTAKATCAESHLPPDWVDLVVVARTIVSRGRTIVGGWTIVSRGRSIVGRWTVVSPARTIVSRGLSVEPRAWCTAKAVA